MKKRKSCIVLIILMIWGLALVNVALASDTVLHRFTGGAGGEWPTTDFIISADGTMYGMTDDGGTEGYGTIFKITKAGDNFKVIHNFTGGINGSEPRGLILDGDYLYGMTQEGGDSEDNCDRGCGTIFKITKAGDNFEVIHDFMGYDDDDGARPKRNLILSGDYLYGITPIGGTSDYCEDDDEYNEGCGTIFKIKKDGNDYAILYNFDGNTKGASRPEGGLTLDGTGTTLYGMTSNGGTKYDGTIFKIPTAGGVIEVIHSFDGANGSSPDGGSLILSGDYLYGMTTEGGTGGYGTIFKITKAGDNFEVIHNFVESSVDGNTPYGSLILSGDYLYGMTQSGGDPGFGTIFKIATNATTGTPITLLHSFAGGTGDGSSPEGSLILDGATLYGMTQYGGIDSTNDQWSGYGTIFSAPTTLPSALSVDPPNLDVTADAGTRTFTVLNSTGTWTGQVTAGNDWLHCTFSSNSGAEAPTDTAAVGSPDISCSFDANAASSRTGTFEVTDDSATVVVQVTQSGTTPNPPPPPCSLSISPFNPSVTGNAGTTTYSVSNAVGYTNVSWTASVQQGGNWFTITSGASGTDSGTITCAFTANPSTAVARTAYIGIVPSDGSCQGRLGIMVTQNPLSASATLLWTKTDGTAWVWSLDSPGNLMSSRTYGPFAGYTADSFHREAVSEGNAQILWDHIDGTASVQFMNDMGDMVNMEYGPEAGWTAVRYHLNSNGTAQMLWDHTDGTASVWTLDVRGNITSRMQYGPYTDSIGTWIATDYRQNSDGTANMLWVRTDAYTSVWTLDSSGNMTSRIYYGPYTDETDTYLWYAQSYLRNSDGTANMLWSRNGHASVWTLNSSGNMTSRIHYGPYQGWVPQNFDKIR